MTIPTDPGANADVLSRAASHLQGAYQLAFNTAGSDLMSPWANTAVSIYLAAAGIDRHLPEAALTTEHPDCLTALRAAQAELLQLPEPHQVPIDELALIRTNLADALTETRALQAAQPPAQP